MHVSFTTCPVARRDFSNCQWLQQLHSLRAPPRLVSTDGGHLAPACIAAADGKPRRGARSVRAVDAEGARPDERAGASRGSPTSPERQGWPIVRAIIAGERDPVRLAALRDGRCRKSVEQIARYLTGQLARGTPLQSG